MLSTACKCFCRFCYSASAALSTPSSISGPSKKSRFAFSSAASAYLDSLSLRVALIRGGGKVKSPSDSAIAFLDIVKLEIIKTLIWRF